MMKGRRKSGFTLIEATLYFAIVGAFLLAATVFSLQILNAFRLSENFHEAQASTMISLNKIVDAIHEAESVVDASCVFDDDNGVLVLDAGDVNVTFYLAGGDLYMLDGGGTPVKLNSESVEVKSLRFHKIEFNKAPPQIMVDGTVEAVSVTAGSSHSFDFHSSASLRKL